MGLLHTLTCDVASVDSNGSLGAFCDSRSVYRQPSTSDRDHTDCSYHNLASSASSLAAAAAASTAAAATSEVDRKFLFKAPLSRGCEDLCVTSRVSRDRL